MKKICCFLAFLCGICVTYAARLASDLTAGVVLGTVGGVVSGVVIKKKQVEKGFDALHCTVGG